VRGMYFFGYGDFVAARGSVGVGITKHLSLHAGYQMGSRLSIHGTSDQIAIRLTQKGPTAGIEIFLGRSSGAEAAAVRSQIAGRLACRLDTLLSLVQRATRKCWGAGICRSRQRKLLRYYFAAQHSADEHTGRASQASRPGDRSGLHEPFVGRKIYAGRESLLRLHHKLQNVLRDPEAYFRLLERDRGSVDVVAGARFWHLDNSLAFLQGGTTAVSIGQTRYWVDPVLGARLRLNLKKGWFASLKGDAGGLGVGSQLTWQIYKGIGKGFKRRYSLLTSYRYLDVDYKNGGLLYDAHMNGPIVGFNIRFK